MTSDTLVLVHTIFRHGERTTDWEFMYPNDPYRKDEFLPYGPGHLTNLGKREMYELGTKIRSQYDGYLGDLYLPKYVDARASHFDRAKTSLQLVLASLFQPTSELNWNENLNWQPIAFKEDEILGAVFSEEFCKLYEEYFENEGKRIFNGHEELLSYLRKHAGGDFKTTRSIWFLHATLSSESANGYKIPDWTSSVYPEITLQFTSDEYYIQTATKQLRKLVVGNLMLKILNDTKAKINSNSEYKIHLYSCHDYNLATALIFFGFSLTKYFPKYAACILMEIHKIKNKHVIKILYTPSKKEDFKYLTFSNGSDTLNLEDFENMVLDVFI
ncbi:Histidine phosphatase superfamily (branch 2) [Popillia japonica]|uniref:acid phosphatase n=1 Tax=Popillia japonica TaxID=7064 RepID=A0AAW1HUH3_POPJA